MTVVVATAYGGRRSVSTGWPPWTPVACTDLAGGFAQTGATDLDNAFIHCYPRKNAANTTS